MDRWAHIFWLVLSIGFPLPSFPYTYHSCCWCARVMFARFHCCCSSWVRIAFVRGLFSSSRLSLSHSPPQLKHRTSLNTYELCDHWISNFNQWMQLHGHLLDACCFARVFLVFFAILPPSRPVISSIFSRVISADSYWEFVRECTLKHNICIQNWLIHLSSSTSSLVRPRSVPPVISCIGRHACTNLW